MKLIENVGKEQLQYGDSEFIRENFLIEELMVPDEILLFYTPYDRIVVGGASPINKDLKLDNYPRLLKADFFCERRELGIINIGDSGKILVDGITYDLEKYACLYLGKGTKDITFLKADSDLVPLFYLVSTSAHSIHPNVYIPKEQAIPMTIGTKEGANERTVYKYIHNDGAQSCQLVMGLTRLHPGNIWNTMPPHVHDRRSEVYFYFEVPDNQAVFHFLGEPTEIKTLITRNHQATLSPPWSIHSGAGTSAYSFIWAMGGENKDYTDMDVLSLNEIS